MESMPNEIKGYKCPDEDCYKCPYRKTKCIVYSKEGQKNYKKWLKDKKLYTELNFKEEKK